MKIQLLFLSLFLSFTVLAQTGKISGVVKTADNKPAEFINVVLEGTTKGAITDRNGEYLISNVSPGAYLLQVSFVGLETKEVRVEVLASQTTPVAPIILNENKQRLSEVVISGSKGYVVQEVSPSLRLGTPLLEIPQNIQVITGEIIEDQQAIDMLETVTRNVSGAQMIEHWGSFARINMRGFKIPAFRNGMNVDLPWGPLTEDMSIVERIEFVKGPAGFMISAGEPGGLYNVVTKKPFLNQRNEVGLTVGSFNTLRATADIGGKLTEDDKLLYRINMMGSTKGSHRNYEFNNRYTIAPSVSYKVNDKTTLTAEYIYQYSQMSALGAAYVFSPGGFGDLPRDFTLLEPNIDPTEIDEHNVFLDINHEISKIWQVTAQLGYLRYEQVGNSLWPDSLYANGDMIRAISISDALNESKMGQIFVNGKLNTGVVTHKILAGVDLVQKDFYADWFQSGTLSDSYFNIYNPTYGVPSSAVPHFDRELSIRERAYGTYSATLGNRHSSLYVQDELGFLDDKIRLTLAGRFTDYSGWSYGSTTNDQVFSPRAGLSVTVAPNTSLYGLYDQSFIPQAGATRTGELFVPVRANNLEAGIKRDWAEGNWSSTLTFYQITKENVVVGDPSPEFPNDQIQLGEVQSQGIEFDVQGEIVDGLQIILNYANTDVEITKDTDETLIGNRVAGHAKHMTNGWLNYTFSNHQLKGFGISLGYQYQVDRSSWNWGTDNESFLPDYFRLDGALSWANENFNVGLNIYNILDDYLYSGSSYDLGFDGTAEYYWQSEPGTNFRLNVTYKF